MAKSARSRSAQTRTKEQAAPPAGLASLSGAEREVLSWSREKRLAEFQKVNASLNAETLEAKLFYIDTITIQNGEILDTLRVSPNVSWEIVRDIFTSGPVDGYTSTFHGLQDINYPEHFWKATIENEREKLH
jgi:hypothetical protein